MMAVARKEGLGINEASMKVCTGLCAQDRATSLEVRLAGICREAGALLESLKHSMSRVMTTKIDNSAQALVEGAHGDLRLLLGQLQMIRLSAASMQYDDIKRQARNAKVRAVINPVKESRHRCEVTSAS